MTPPRRVASARSPAPDEEGPPCLVGVALRHRAAPAVRRRVLVVRGEPAGLAGWGAQDFCAWRLVSPARGSADPTRVAGAEEAGRTPGLSAGECVWRPSRTPGSRTGGARTSWRWTLPCAPRLRGRRLLEAASPRKSAVRGLRGGRGSPRGDWAPLARFAAAPCSRPGYDWPPGGQSRSWSRSRSVFLRPDS